MRFKITKRRIVILIIILGLFGVGGYYLFGNKPKTQYTTEKIKFGTLTQTVSETGSIDAAEKINLNFLATGRLARLNVKIGDQVEAGQILAELDNRSLLLRQQQAQADLMVAQANLSKLLSGVTVQELNVSQANVDKAKAAYESAQDGLDKTEQAVNESINQAQTKVNDFQVILANGIYKSTYQQAVVNSRRNALVTMDDKLASANTALDAVKTIFDDSDAKDTLSVANPTYLEQAKTNYDLSQPLLVKAKSSLAGAKINQDNTTINQALSDTLSALNKVFDTLNYTYKALEKSVTTSDFSQAELDAYKTSVSGHLTTIGTAISSIQSSQQSLTTASLALDDAMQTANNNLATAQKNGAQQIATAQAQVDTALKTWQVAQAQLAQTKAAPRSQDISLYQAQVAQAQAAYEIAQKQVEDSVIKAPIKGVITESNYEVGEDVSSTKNALAMVGENSYEIKVDISEADIYKVKMNNPAEITLDAFGEDVKFSGIVNFIEPAETIIQDVVYYKVTILLNSNTEEQPYYAGVKPGMTANVVITTAKKDNVLTAPGRAIIDNKDGRGKLARLLKSGKLTEVPVQTGLKGDGGMVEILSGLNEGEDVVTYVEVAK